MHRFLLLALLSSTACVHAFNLELLWAKMVDDEGEFDVDLPTPQSCENAEFSPDETLVATVAKGDFTTRLLRAEDGRQLWSVKEEGETECITFTADGKFILNGGENNALRVRRVEDGVEILSLPVGASIEGLRFSPDYQLLATGDEAGKVRIWRTPGSDPRQWPREPAAILAHGEDENAGGPKGQHADVNQVDWSADGRFLFSGSRSRWLKQWEVAAALKGGQAEVRRFGPLHASIKCARLSPDGALLAAGCGHDPQKKLPAQVAIFRVADGQPVLVWDFPDFQVFETVAWTPDGKHLIAGGDVLAGGEQGCLAIWKTDDLLTKSKPPVPRRFPVHNQEYLFFSKDGSRLLTSHQDGSVRLWKVLP